MVHEQTMGNLIYVKHQSILFFVFWGRSLTSIFLRTILFFKKLANLVGFTNFQKVLSILENNFGMHKKVENLKGLLNGTFSYTKHTMIQVGKISSQNFLFILYYAIGDRDYIKMTKIPRIPKWDFQNLLVLLSYELYNFMNS